MQSLIDSGARERQDGMSSMSPHVSIILLNWNQPELTMACIESLNKITYPSYDIWLVDNGSHDGSVPYIRERCKTITLIENSYNMGFTGGNNVAIKRAMDAKADYILLLNNDTEVDAEFLNQLVSVAEADPAIGVVGPKILYFDHPDIVWSAGGAVSQYGQAHHLGENERDSGSPGVVKDVDYVTGCALLIKRAVIERIGSLDERFFIYFEETEWCARARRAGFRVVYAPQARVWHKIKMTARMSSSRYLYMMARNRLLYLKLTGATPRVMTVAILDVLRTAASWSLRPQHKEMRPFSGALARGVGDFLFGRFGEPPRVYC
jgi:GT2 family glycosyltransferase